jgi:hypothetical protein
MHIRGAILDLDRQFQLSHSLGLEHGEGNPGLEKGGVIPWHPNGAPFDLTIPKVITPQRPAASHIRTRLHLVSVYTRGLNLQNSSGDDSEARVQCSFSLLHSDHEDMDGRTATR